MTSVSVNAILSLMEQVDQLFSGGDHKVFEHVDNNSQPLHMRKITWEASEYVHHDKGAAWLVILALVAIAGVGVTVWLKQWMFAFLIAIMAVAFGYYAVRKPQTLQYSLDDEGLTINKKAYPMTDFRAFGVIEDGALFTIRLIPIKRLAPAILIYF